MPLCSTMPLIYICKNKKYFIYDEEKKAFFSDKNTIAYKKKNHEGVPKLKLQTVLAHPHGFHSQATRLFSKCAAGIRRVKDVVLADKSFHAVDVTHVAEARHEAVKLHLVAVGPLHLAKCGKAREQLPFQFFAVGHPFCPYTSFRSDDVIPLLGRQFLKLRVM